MKMCRALLLTSLCLGSLCLTVGPAISQETLSPEHRACDAAAAKAERDWNVPAGVLAAVGTVESGRSWSRVSAPMPWPWTINADGQGFFLPTKAAAISTAAALLARGARYVDVGCFQVDLAFHGRAFASLEDAFDPQANAQTAARILVAGRLGEHDWSGAVARYHSTSPVRGGLYLERVRKAFSFAQSRIWSILLDERGFAQHVVLLSPKARLVRVLTAEEPSPEGTAGATSVTLPNERRAAPRPQIIRLVPMAKLPAIADNLR
jgi:hypothetical protein